MALVETISRALFGSVEAIAGPVRLTPVDLAYALRSERLTGQRDTDYELYADYYNGKQSDPRDLDFGTRREPQRRTFKAQHNFCSVVVDVLIERMSVIGFTVTGDTVSEAQQTELAKRLWHWWQSGRMDATQVTVHAETAIAGDGFLLVDYDVANERPRFSFRPALNITPVYDAKHVMTMAYQSWTEPYLDDKGERRTRQRITKYTPALIEKWVNEGKGWVLWTQDVDSNGLPDNGIVNWVDDKGDPLGLPVIHFRNKPRNSDYGRSELADIIPIQDEYNRRVWNTSEAMSFAGNTQKYIIDAKPPGKVNTDTDGRMGGFVSGPGYVWQISSRDKEQTAQAGQFAPSDIGQLQDATDRELKTLAGQSRTPVHLIWPDGTLPSGESLKTAEAPLVAKCRDRSIVLGNSWEDAMQLAIRVHNRFGPKPAMPDHITISTMWDSFETRSALLDEQVIALRRDDIGRDQANRERGYDEETIQRINDEIGEATPPALKLADQFARPVDMTQQDEGQ